MSLRHRHKRRGEEKLEMWDRLKYEGLGSRTFQFDYDYVTTKLTPRKGK